MFRKRDFFKRKSKQPDFSLINQSVVSDLYVSAIIYPRNEYVTGYVVFVGINNEGETVKCAGNAPGISPGEHVRVNGVWQIHNSPDFGDEIQICFSEIISLELETEAEIARYLEKMNVPGCGKQTVKKIIAKYGLSTLKVITEHPDAFAEEKIFGVNQAVLRNICAAVTRKIKSRAAYNSLLKKGFSEAQSILLAEKYGDRVEEIYENDCYFFALDNEEITFKEIDSILLRSGKYRLDSDVRLAAGIEYAVRLETKNGHIYTTRDDIKARVRNILGYPPDYDEADFSRIFADAVGVINRSKTVEKRYFVKGNDRTKYEFRLRRYADSERKIAENLTRLCTSRSGKKTINASYYISDNFNLSKSQKAAVCSVFTSPISVITGGPGTGKSYIAKAVYDTALKMGLSCIAAAPTGRAAKRLEEAIFRGKVPEEEARPQTIHRLLKATGVDKFTHGEKYPLHTDILIIDESSMIDAALAAALLSAVSPETGVVFMGDVNQLPSVGAGDFFGDLIAAIETPPEADEEAESGKYRNIPVTRLTEIYRQEEGNIIIANSVRINAGKFPICSSGFNTKEDNFIFLETPPSQGVSVLADCVADKIPAHFGIDPLKEVQVLLPKNIGKSGADKVNRILRDWLNPRNQMIPDYAVGATTFREGDKVMQKVNDYDLLVFNGDVGYVDSVCDTGMNIFFPDYGKTLFYSRAKTYNLALAYAITVHKSQGAEFEAAVILMDEYNADKVMKNLLYTSVTRAKKAVVMIGSRSAYINALKNTGFMKRRTHLQEEIQTAFGTSVI